MQTLDAKVEVIEAKVPEPDWFEEGMKAKIQEIAERDPTPRNLLELERTSHLFKALLAVWKNPFAAGHGKMIGGYGQYSLNQGDYGDSTNMEIVDSDGGIMLQNTAPRAETFGATVVRELVASFKELAASLGPKEQKPGVVELVHAIALARAEHMDDLADKLEAELLESQEASAEAVGTDPKLLSRSGAWPPASAVDALLPSDPATPADMGARQAMVDDVSTAPRIVVHDATTAPEALPGAFVAPFCPAGVKPATPAEAVALFDAMRKKQREGKMLTRDEQRAAVGGAIVTHSDPMLTPPMLVRKTPFDPNGGSGVGEYQPLHPGRDDVAASKAELDRVLTVYRAVLLIVKAAFAEACHARHDREAVDKQIEVMEVALASLPAGWSLPDNPVGGALRDALCDVKTALGSIAFSPPEGMPLHLGRIREALHLLPKGWDDADPSPSAMHAAGIGRLPPADPPDARPEPPVADLLPLAAKPPAPPWHDGPPGYDAEGRLTDPTYKGT